MLSLTHSLSVCLPLQLFNAGSTPFSSLPLFYLLISSSSFSNCVCFVDFDSSFTTSFQFQLTPVCSFILSRSDQLWQLLLHSSSSFPYSPPLSAFQVSNIALHCSLFIFSFF